MKPIFQTAVVALFAFGPAHAATIQVGDLTKSAYDAALAGMATPVVENFESFAEGNIDAGVQTAVGTFSSVGGTGTGRTVTDGLRQGNFAGNDGTKLAIRDGHVYGRASTTGMLSGTDGGGMFLDSNDTHGMRWDVSLGGAMFNRLVFTLVDAADAGATMKLSAAGATHTLTGMKNGAKNLVEIAFGQSVSTATILFENYDRNFRHRRNDGFSVDDIALNAVPLPAGMWFLLGGLGALAALRRRQRAV